jgi:hypothetical protein
VHSQKQRLPLLLPSAGWPFTAGRAVCPACTRPIRPAAVVKSKGCLSCLSCLCKATLCFWRMQRKGKRSKGCKATLCFWRMLAKAKGAKVVTLACYPGGNGGLRVILLLLRRNIRTKVASFASPFAFCWLAFYCWQGCMPCLHQAYSASCCSQKQRLPLLLPSAGWPFTACLL